MGAKIMHLGGYQDGTRTLYPHSTSYVQGQPLKVRIDDLLELCLCYREGHDDGYCGLAKGHFGSMADQKSDLYNGKATYWAGYNQLKLDAEDPENPADGAGTDDYPYDTDDVYQGGDDLYINTAGKLTNAAGPYDEICDGATPVAYVVEVGTTYLIINQVR